MFSPSVAEELMGRLLRNHHAMTEEIARHGGENEDDFFFLVENARLSRGLASYYRRLLFDSMGAVEARNRHLATILDALLYAPGALPTRRSARRMVVWTHNALLGDTRALEEEGETASLRVLPPSLGQLVRERHAGEAFLIGQTTALGTVTTASGWDRPVERRVLEAAPPGSVEALFHQAGIPQMMLNLQADDDATELLREAMVERSFGPVLPAGEQRIRARMADRFDAVLHFDESRAVEPLEG